MESRARRAVSIFFCVGGNLADESKVFVIISIGCRSAVWVYSAGDEYLFTSNQIA